MTDLRLSVVLTVVDGGDALRRCLRALLSQQNAPSMEILVPYDSTVPAVASIVADVSRDAAASSAIVRTLDLGRLETRRDRESAGGQHELIDRRRSAGLAAARGEIVAIVEDRGVPRADWAAAAVGLHDRHSNGAIGGAVENGRDAMLNWAVYLCDFARYQPPFAAGSRRYVSDVNVAYKRRALEQTRDIWRDRFHEPWVHSALERSGETLFLSPDLVVHQVRDGLSLASLLRERIAWGRLFGALRARHAPLRRRLTWVALSPAVPAVLFARILRGRGSKPPAAGRLLLLTPITLLLLSAWAAGEAMGSISADP
ncbi:MAG: hypothetical protein ACM4AI_09120 [Acidobacteriota bacterium]